LEEKEIICWKNYNKQKLHEEFKKFNWTDYNKLTTNEKANMINESLKISLNNIVQVKKIKIINMSGLIIS
jgi:hypothetical protein